MKHSLILYGSHERPLYMNASGARLTRNYLSDGVGRTAYYFVRMEVFNGESYEALAAAKPMEGETILNVVPLYPMQEQIS